jgi:hypothetical protein
MTSFCVARVRTATPMPDLVGSSPALMFFDDLFAEHAFDKEGLTFAMSIAISTRPGTSGLSALALESRK